MSKINNDRRRIIKVFMIVKVSLNCSLCLANGLDGGVTIIVRVCTLCPCSHSDFVVPPHPIQLVAFGDVVVEYTAAHTWELSGYESEKTLHSSLTWYHSSGRHKTLDVLSIAKEHFKSTKSVS